MSNFDERCEENEFSRKEIKRLKKLLKTKKFWKKTKLEIESKIEGHEMSIEWNQEQWVPTFI